MAIFASVFFQRPNQTQGIGIRDGRGMRRGMEVDVVVPSFLSVAGLLTPLVGSV